MNAKMLTSAPVMKSATIIGEFIGSNKGQIVDKKGDGFI